MAVGMVFDLDLLSGMQCGVSEGKIMCVNCVGLIFLSALYLYCGIHKKEFIFFPLFFLFFSFLDE